MNREAATARVLEYVYGEMTPDEAEAFEKVLAADADLAAEVEALRSVRKAASGLPRVHLPSEARRRILRAAHNHARMASRAFDFAGFLERLVLSPGFSGALVVVVALGVGTHLVMYGGIDQEPSLTELEARSASREIAADKRPTAVAETREVAAAPADEPSGGVPQAGTAQAPEPGKPGPKRSRASAFADLLDTRAAGAKGGEADGFANAPAGLGIIGMGRGGGGAGGMGGGALGKSDAGPAARAPDAPRPVVAAEKASPAPKPADSDRSYDEERAEASRDDAGHGKAKKKAESPMAAAPSPAPASAPASSGKPAASTATADATLAFETASEGEPTDARGLLAAARKQRAAGRDVAALDLYGRAIAAGLAGRDLETALAEAAALARKLGRTALATAYEERLQSLGKKQAAPAADE